MPLDAQGPSPSPLDPDERARLRTALGLGESTAASFDPQRVVGARPGPGDDVAFLLGDLERKVDKLLDTAATVDQLTSQVRVLSEHVIELERALIGLR